MSDQREAKVVGPSCSTETYEHCVTCSDEALQVKVLSVDAAAGLALVAGMGTSADGDISLVGGVAPGDTLLIHGGIAIGKL